ncbi:gliding motility lipoprotein GldD [Aureitalea sp. L0-47]|uniref:gliding motility lipoprotein GldD n=1 Tax=Aureitalea sp. L0-47 TaxID=2816962 RepID=UPI002237761F|nr:gliding motility lipoprotein GldD [Aureitalea sp. L0-47]MCW5518395.1 gliding motility lipoprotein GldD [Aureitalea sp. L0-47]
MRIILALSVLLILASCNDDVVVKPAAMLRLEYPASEYNRVDPDCPYGFEKNKQAELVLKDKCWMNLTYPKMKATIYLTYQQVKDNNLDSLLYDAQKLTYDHTVKAETILEQPRVDSVNKVYGMFYMINGNAATQSQFYVTDSLNHFITGSLYFESKPKFDSLYPAVVYLREDIRRIMETVYWRN